MYNRSGWCCLDAAAGWLQFLQQLETVTQATHSQPVYSEIPQVHTKVGHVSLFIFLLLTFIPVIGQVRFGKRKTLIDWLTGSLKHFMHILNHVFVAFRIGWKIFYYRQIFSHSDVLCDNRREKGKFAITFWNRCTVLSFHFQVPLQVGSYLSLSVQCVPFVIMFVKSLDKKYFFLNANILMTVARLNV